MPRPPQVDLRTSAGLEGYRRNLGDELDTVKRKLQSTGPDPARSSAGLAPHPALVSSGPGSRPGSRGFAL